MQAEDFNTGQYGGHYKNWWFYVGVCVFSNESRFARGNLVRLPLLVNRTDAQNGELYGAKTTGQI